MNKPKYYKITGYITKFKAAVGSRAYRWALRQAARVAMPESVTTGLHGATTTDFQRDFRAQIINQFQLLSCQSPVT